MLYEVITCYSACPVYAVNPAFEGPFALTRSWRYVSDARAGDVRAKLEAVQQNGIWDCTLCNECVPVCPQGIAPKQDINMLRSKSGMEGVITSYSIHYTKLYDIDAKPLYIGLDVLEKEPMSDPHPLTDIHHKERLYITPHIAWASVEARETLIAKVIENIRTFVDA